MTKLRYPLKEVRITQKFGENPAAYAGDGLAGHNGVDFGCPVGTELLAAGNGVVIEVGNQGKVGYGKFFRIRTVSGLQLTYGHCSKILVESGQVVMVGQVVALSGNTGRSTGPHLHFGVRAYTASGDIANYDNGYKGAIDPLPFIMNEAIPTFTPEQVDALKFDIENKFTRITEPEILLQAGNRIDMIVARYRYHNKLKAELAALGVHLTF